MVFCFSTFWPNRLGAILSAFDCIEGRVSAGLVSRICGSADHWWVDGKYRIQIPTLSTSLTRSTSQSCHRKVRVNDEKREKDNFADISLLGNTCLCVIKTSTNGDPKMR